MEGYWVWCGSVVKGEDGRFHMFASRWPKYLPMHPGWLAASEVVRAVSDTPEGPYTFQEVVLPTRGAQYWDGRATHNPHIVKYEDTYILYYMGSTHPFSDVAPGEVLTLQDSRYKVGHANKRVGIAVSRSIFGPWKRMDNPVLPTRPGHFDSYLTSNPAPCIDQNGSVLLIYKARQYIGNGPGHMTIGAAKAANYLGPYLPVADEALFPETMIIEDPFIWRTSGGYELIAKDMTGHICGEKYGGMQASSMDGRHWTAREGRQAYSRTVRWDDGTVTLLGNMDRPFLLFQENRPTHLFFAASDGTNSFLDASDTWNMVIPLRQD
ncbi:glycoside hydrolase family protein [Paenibacillus roseipurpureus]|uniref:Glycoside hydrolase family protein n=1 Tax=Paenibacillus roseopurpureus TaxID=2918901 RepID=A0AA96RL53_9BACL|nr:glycoside hydrolase family protein [Paenibacillus sp. MBLB1832]WNR45410.1 glycoside hydrolase family protein [Paenibacillus sp. MBLB1832]